METQHADEQTESRKTASRERSTIGFPYDDLDTAVQLVDVAHNKFGGSPSLDQLAAGMDQKPNSGAFRSKISAAKQFGVIEDRRGEVEVSNLGRSILSPDSAAQARVEAFLNVPLYRALYERFKGTLLPSDAGLETTIRDLGVASKQVATARQVFQRAAEQAGFFNLAQDRLVMPPVGPPPQSMSENGAAADPLPDLPDPAPPREAALGGGKPTIIVEVFKRLPDEGEPFSEEERARWLRLLESTLDVVYQRESIAPSTSWADAEDPF